MADQPFLRDRSHQLTCAVVHTATGESTGIARPRAVHGVEQPVIGSQVGVEPQRVIEAGDPDWTPGKRPRFVLVYGDPSRQWAEGYTMAGIRKLERRILKMRLGDKARKALLLQLIEQAMGKVAYSDNLPEEGEDAIGVDEG